jgi:hypothetical protein
VSLPNYGKNLPGKRFMLEPFFGNFKCLPGSLGVTGNFSASNREKAKNQGNGVKKQTNQPTDPRERTDAMMR